MKKSTYRDRIVIAFVLGLAWGCSMVGYLATELFGLLGLASIIALFFGIWAAKTTGAIRE